MGAVYKALDRLEDKGLVASRIGEPTPERGGRRKKHFRLSAAGQRALRTRSARFAHDRRARSRFQAAMQPPRLARTRVRTACPSRTGSSCWAISTRDSRSTQGSAAFAARRRYWMRRLAQSGTAGLAPTRCRRRTTGTREFDMGNFRRDVRFGVRALWHSPVYSLVAIATLALAIGANTLLFSIANPLVIRACRSRTPARSAGSSSTTPSNDSVRGAASVPEFSSGARSRRRSRQTRGARASRRDGHRSWRSAPRAGHRRDRQICDLWGLHPSSAAFPNGRRRARPPMVVVLSHHLLAADTIRADPTCWDERSSLDDTPATIVGVMEPEIESTPASGLGADSRWIRARRGPPSARCGRRRRLARGATLDAADAEIKAMAAGRKLHPDTILKLTPSVVSTHTAISGPDTWVLLCLLAVSSASCS